MSKSKKPAIGARLLQTLSVGSNPRVLPRVVGRYELGKGARDKREKKHLRLSDKFCAFSVKNDKI